MIFFLRIKNRFKNIYKISKWRPPSAFFVFLLAFYLGSYSFVSAHATLLGNFEGKIDGSTIHIKVTLPENREVDDPNSFAEYTVNNILLKNQDGDCPIENVVFKSGLPTVITMDAVCRSAIEKLTGTIFYFIDEGYAMTVGFTSNGITKNAYVDETNYAISIDFNAPGSTDASTSRDFSATSTPSAEAISSTSTSSMSDSGTTLTFAGKFLVLGIKHIYTGLDHILFVLALIIAASSLKNLLKSITAFTLAHSITLALSATGYVSIPSSIVEPIIAFSIFYVAIEDIIYKKYGQKIPKIFGKTWLVAFIFGLFHGLGFSSVLREIEVPGNLFLTALVSFNVGVEIAQITIVLMVLPVLHYLRRLASYSLVQKLSLSAIGTAGLVWFIFRVAAII